MSPKLFLVNTYGTVANTKLVIIGDTARISHVIVRDRIVAAFAIQQQRRPSIEAIKAWLVSEACRSIHGRRRDISSNGSRSAHGHAFEDQMKRSSRSWRWLEEPRAHVVGRTELTLDSSPTPEPPVFG